MWWKHRLCELVASDAQILTAAFEADFFDATAGPRFVALIVTQTILDGARALVRVPRAARLRCSELSSALVAREADPTCTSFAAYDDSLRATAAAEGFLLLPTTRAGAPRVIR